MTPAKRGPCLAYEAAAIERCRVRGQNTEPNRHACPETQACLLPAFRPTPPHAEPNPAAQPVSGAAAFGSSPDFISLPVAPVFSSGKKLAIGKHQPRVTKRASPCRKRPVTSGCERMLARVRFRFRFPRKGERNAPRSRPLRGWAACIDHLRLEMSHSESGGTR